MASLVGAAWLLRTPYSEVDDHTWGERLYGLLTAPPSWMPGG